MINILEEQPDRCIELLFGGMYFGNHARSDRRKGDWINMGAFVRARGMGQSLSEQARQ
jgi:hypothetical protein